jgi:antitoxin (DNA-binding transcriptional repressor) of toxin-antitoxin stability system
MSDTPEEEPDPRPVSVEHHVEGGDVRTREPGRPAARAQATERPSARQQIGIRELRQHASIYVDLAERGYTVDITNRGRLVAQLVPVREPGSPLERLIAAGIIESAEEPGGVGDIEPYPPSAAERATASNVLRQARQGQVREEQAREGGVEDRAAKGEGR